MVDTKIYRLLVHNIEFIFHTIFGKRKSSKKSGKNIFQLYIAAARGTTGENSLMLYDLISVSHSSSSISKSTSKILIKNGKCNYTYLFATITLIKYNIFTYLLL